VKTNHAIALDFATRLHQNEDEENLSCHGFSKEVSCALASFRQTKLHGSDRAGGAGDKIWDAFNLDLSQLPAPMQEHAPNLLTSEHCKKWLRTGHNVTKREAHLPEAGSCLPPARPKDSFSVACGSQRLVNPTHKRACLQAGQALAMIGQARWNALKQRVSVMCMMSLRAAGFVQANDVAKAAATCICASDQINPSRFEQSLRDHTMR
jgi:hypothetical protein